MGNKRILVVDDSALYQRLLSDVINSRDGLEVVGVASNGKAALVMLEQLRPDLVTLDILMPEMDGIQTLMEIRKSFPSVKTFMISSLTTPESDIANDVLALGATAFSIKPSSVGGLENFRIALETDILPTIETMCGLKQNIPDPGQPAVTSAVASGSAVSKKAQAIPFDSSGGIELIAIGVSTGGPEALAVLLADLPADLGVPIVIVQHMPAEFTAKLARRLDASCALNVVEAQLDETLCAGTVYIAPGDYHMVLGLAGGDVKVNLNRGEPENSCRPSVDPLFRSIPGIYGGHCLGIILTGMGSDGLRGSEALYDAGCPIIVQDEKSSVVWGMPKLVAQAGLSQQQVPLSEMASVVINFLDRSARSTYGEAANEDTARLNTLSGKR